MKNGESGTVISIVSSHNLFHTHRQRRRRRGHGRESFQKRMEDMGLTPGAKVTMVKSAPFRGPLELRIRGTRLAIGRGMAERVLVRVER